MLNLDELKYSLLKFGALIAGLKLYKGSIMVVGRKSETNSLFDESIATFEDDAGAYDQKDAEGFIKLNALRLRVAAKRDM